MQAVHLVKKNTHGAAHQRQVFLPCGFATRKKGSTGTRRPLSPIPGTPSSAPVAAAPTEGLHNSLSAAPAGAALQVATAAQPQPACVRWHCTPGNKPAAVLVRDSHGHPLPPPVLQADNSTLLCLKQELTPAKVFLPEHVAGVRRISDLTVPLKKMPVYSEFASKAADFLKELQRDLPVKMQVPAFLVQGPPHVQHRVPAR